MTCVEKLRQDHPEMDEFDIGYLVGQNCPNEHGYPEPHDCDFDCKNCWDREIPEEKTLAEKTGEAYAKIKDIVQEHGGITVHVEPTIKDSGDRTEFESGAVRDMREGKGRCDLMPLEVVRDLTNDQIIGYIVNFMQDNDTSELYNCLDEFARAFDDGLTKASLKDIQTQRYCTMFLEVAKHYEEGAKKYGENNWQKGMPTWCYIDSAIRHYLKWLRGDTDEPHDRAFVWNIMCCIWEVDYRKKEDV